MPRTRVDHPTTVAAVMAPVERPRPLLPRSCAPSQRNSLNLDSAANSKAELPPLACPIKPGLMTTLALSKPTSRTPSALTYPSTDLYRSALNLSRIVPHLSVTPIENARF